MFVDDLQVHRKVVDVLCIVSANATSYAFVSIVRSLNLEVNACD